MKTCQHCGGPMPPRQKGPGRHPVHCSPECRIEHKRQKARENYRDNPEKRQEAISSAKAWYADNRDKPDVQARIKAQNDAKNEQLRGPKIARDCATCGEPLSMERRRDAIYCSDKCARSAFWHTSLKPRVLARVAEIAEQFQQVTDPALRFELAQEILAASDSVTCHARWFPSVDGLLCEALGDA